jgi:hypothetical protein
MKILLILDAEPADSDPGDSTGLTEEAFVRLSEAVADAGFTLVKGPDAEPSEITFT